MTSDVTILPNAAPMITPIARSRTLPRMMNFLNSENILIPYHLDMAELIVITVPCCQAELHIDPETSAVIRHKEHVKPPTITDMEAAVKKLKAEAGPP